MKTTTTEVTNPTKTEKIWIGILREKNTAIHFKKYEPSESHNFSAEHAILDWLTGQCHGNMTHAPLPSPTPDSEKRTKMVSGN